MTRRTHTILVALGMFLLVACGKKQAPAPADDGAAAPKAPQNISLQGAGATFPFPLYSKWMSEYNRLHPEIRINYQSIGSGGGIRQIVKETVDFGASDAPMKDEDAKEAKGKLLHIPTTIGAVVLAYNVPGITVALKVDADVVADIFLGKIKKWNDPRLTKTNEGVTLPATAISLVQRSDGSGTTSVFTDYLASVSPEWKESVGAGKSVKWPVGLGAKGNEGVTGQVKTTPGAVGYVELAYAIQNKLIYASIKNTAGEYIEPKIDAITAAGAGAVMPDVLYTSLVNPSGPGAYPISSYTYMLVYEDAKDATKGRALAEFLWWSIHDGQKLAADLHYAPLPAAVVAQVEKRLKSLTSGGKPLLSGM